jgi:hypothetical protein
LSEESKSELNFRRHEGNELPEEMERVRGGRD